MITKNVSIDLPIQYARNPRNNKDAIDYVASSIKEFGFQQPIVIDKDNTIIVGHTRLLAAKKLGLKEVPIHIAEGLTPQQIKAYRIADNKTADYSEFDNELLVLELSELKEANYDLTNTAFDSEELDLLLETEHEGLTDDDNIPIVEEEPVAKLGDLYILGNHRLLCGDATNKENVVRLMNGQKTDMCITDPPYGVNYIPSYECINKKVNTTRVQHTILNDEDASIYSQTVKIICEFVDGPCYIWYSILKSNIVLNNILDNDGILHSVIIWYKTGSSRPGAILSNYMFKYEPCVYWKPKNTTLRWDGPTNEVNVWEIEKPCKSPLHPTQKPTELAERMIRNHKVTTVLDLFGGSGSTLIACEKTNRKCYMMELDEHYCDVIVKRWEDYTGKKAQLETK